VVNILDVQLATNMALGKATCTAGAGVCDIVLVQRIVNAAVTGTCTPAVPHSVTLNWTASTSANVTGYYVYRSGSSTGPYTKLNATPVKPTTFTDEAVTAGQTYYYVVTAVDSSNSESAYSNQARAVIPSP